MTIYNAKIISTTLGKEDHDIFTFFLHLEFEYGTQGFGGYCLDSYNKKLKRRVCVGVGLEVINQILDTVGVNIWEKLPGHYVRVKLEKWNSPIKEIGNIMKDKWFNIEQFFKENKEI